jgi:protein-tyrosine phosphatase
VLVVCTANVCRSPMVEALIARRLAREGVNAVVRSAGVHARDAAPPIAEVVAVMREFGIDVSGHVSRPVMPELIKGADLVIGLAREHVRETVVLEPDSYGRTFTLRELVRRSRAAGARPAGTELVSWLESLTADRDVEAFLGASPDDDVADPVGRPLAVVRQTAAELSDLVQETVALIWPVPIGR